MTLIQYLISKERLNDQKRHSKFLRRASRKQLLISDQWTTSQAFDNLNDNLKLHTWLKTKVSGI